MPNTGWVLHLSMGYFKKNGFVANMQAHTAQHLITALFEQDPDVGNLPTTNWASMNESTQSFLNRSLWNQQQCGVTLRRTSFS